MLLQVRNLQAYPLETINYPAYAVLSATGEPRGRRRWSIHLSWNLGAESRGAMDDQSRWLHVLLENLIRFERNSLGFKQNANSRLLEKIRNKQLRLIVPPALRRSVNNTKHIYCDGKIRSRMRWIQDYPRD